MLDNPFFAGLKNARRRDPNGSCVRRKAAGCLEGTKIADGGAVVFGVFEFAINSPRAGVPRRRQLREFANDHNELSRGGYRWRRFKIMGLKIFGERPTFWDGALRFKLGGDTAPEIIEGADG